MMTKEEIFELMDIETGEDFTYFENFANLMEADEYITEEDIGMLIKELDCVTFLSLQRVIFMMLWSICLIMLSISTTPWRRLRETSFLFLPQLQRVRNRVISSAESYITSETGT